MPNRNMVKLSGWSLLALGALLLVLSGMGSLLCATHALSSRDGELVSPGSSEVSEQVYVGRNNFVKREILLSGPGVLAYRLPILFKSLVPARLYLRGGVDVSRGSELADDRFGGLKVRLRINGREEYCASFDDDLHYRTFSVKLPQSGEAKIEFELDPGKEAKAGYDRAVIKNPRVEPSFAGAFVLAGVLFVTGGGLLRFTRPKIPRPSEEEPGQGPKARRLSTGRKIFYSLLVTVVFSAITLEAAFMKLARSSLSSRFPWILPPGLTRSEPSEEWVFDPVAGYAMRSNREFDFEFDGGRLADLKKLQKPVTVHYWIDEHGFRSRTDPGLARIAVLGDSFTFGGQVPHPFPDRVADLLAVPVYNLGTNGYGTLQEQAALERMLPCFDNLQLVVLAWFGGNDIQNNERFANLRDPWSLMSEYQRMVNQPIMTAAPDRYCLLERSLTGRLLIRLGPGLETLAQGFDLLDCLPPPSGSPESAAPAQSSAPTGRNKIARGLGESKEEPLQPGVFAMKLNSGQVPVAFEPLLYFDPEGSPGLEAGLAAIGRIKDMLNEQEKKLLVCYLPPKFETYCELIKENYSASQLGYRMMHLARGWEAGTPEELVNKIENATTLQVERLSHYCASHHIPFLDLTPGLRRRAREKLWYYENDGHFNQDGHDLVARLISREINRLWPGSFPALKD